MGWLLIADLALRWLPYRRAESLLTKGLNRKARRPSAGEIAALAAQVDAVARYHLYPMQCLRRALVLRRVLHARGVATDLRFGVCKEEDRLVAHAWLEHEGRSLDPNPATKGYVTLAAEGPEGLQVEGS
jgi:hypothetical protein